jgi:DNA-binding transcriptional ArsR family regulator
MRRAPAARTIGLSLMLAGVLLASPLALAAGQLQEDARVFLESDTVRPDGPAQGFARANAQPASAFLDMVAAKLDAADVPRRPTTFAAEAACDGVTVWPGAEVNPRCTPTVAISAHAERIGDVQFSVGNRPETIASSLARGFESPSAMPGDPFGPYQAEAAAPSPVPARTSFPAPEELPMEVPSSADGTMEPAGAGTMPAASLLDASIVAATLAVGALVALFALYHRIQPGNLLANETRSRLFRVIRSTPGLSRANLARATGLHKTTVRYHLDLLVDGGYVMRRATGSVERYFEVGMSENAVETCLPSHADTQSRIAHAIRSHPGRTLKEIVEETGVSYQLASHHMHRLASAGHVALRRDGRCVRAFPASPQG